MSTKYWLMKAEPDSRVVKGKDVKVSYHILVFIAVLKSRCHFLSLASMILSLIKLRPGRVSEIMKLRIWWKKCRSGTRWLAQCQVTLSWDGILKGDIRSKVLFYHSNCKTPGKTSKFLVSWWRQFLRTWNQALQPLRRCALKFDHLF